MVIGAFKKELRIHIWVWEGGGVGVVVHESKQLVRKNICSFLEVMEKLFSAL